MQGFRKPRKIDIIKEQQKYIQELEAFIEDLTKIIDSSNIAKSEDKS